MSVQRTIARPERCWVFMLAALGGEKEQEAEMKPKGGWDIASLVRNVRISTKRANDEIYMYT